MLWKKNDAYLAMFRVVDATGTAVTGLTNGNFTKFLYNAGSSSGQTVTVTEVANGQYKVEYTPNATGFWTLVITHSTYFPEGKVDDLHVIDTSSDLIELIADIILIRGTSNVESLMADHRNLAGAISTICNKKSISGSTLTVKKADDSTNLYTAALTTDSGQDPVVSVDPT